MTEAVTIGMVVKALLIIGGIGLAFGVFVFILAIFADAWKH